MCYGISFSCVGIAIMDQDEGHHVFVGTHRWGLANFGHPSN
jgi:hypothetical protein